MHPQFWPEDLDYAGKRIVIIGSGATAVTLVPSMASASTHVTMLQRSLTWISAVPSRDARADWLRANLPQALAHRIIRAENVAFGIGFYQFCQRMPSRARRLLIGRTMRMSPQPLFGLTSGYVQRSVNEFPKQAAHSPWRTRQNYLLDALSSRHKSFAATLRPVGPTSRSADDLRTTHFGSSE